jgi:hypothetical protein
MMKAKELWTLIGNFVIELIVYGILVVLYSVLALRLLGEPLAQLFGNHLIAYAFTSLALVVAQAVLLDFATSFLLDRLHLERME